eukprot:999225-Rhodomonas_salina.1
MVQHELPTQLHQPHPDTFTSMSAFSLKFAGTNPAGTSFLLTFAVIALVCVNAVPVADKSALEAMRDQCLALNAGGLSSTHGDACDQFSNADTSLITDMSNMFGGTSFNGNIANWNVSAVNDMGGMFRDSSFNGNIANWDVSAVNDMSGMFTESLFTGNISKWDVSAVNDMSYMFQESSFTGDLSKWDVSAVKDMRR